MNNEEKILEMLAQIQSEIKNNQTEINKRFDTVDEKMDFLERCINEAA